MSEKAPEKAVEPPATEASTAASKPTTAGAESPRTAKELDFDDEVHETLPVPERQATPKGTKRVSFQDDDGPTPPPKPPRPMSPQAQAEATLIEAFPSIDAKVVKAVLVASGGKVEPAFNALLSMSDPTFENDHAPPPPPRKPMTQLESDELYARQLAEHYDSAYTGFGSRDRGDPPRATNKQDTGLKPNEMYDDKEHSFFDDDLPVIKQNLQKGFQDTKTTINKWIKDFQRKLDGDEEEDPIAPGPSRPQQKRQDFGPSASNQIYGIRKSADGTRRSGDRDRYDADPQVLSDDFGHRLELRDDEAPPTRPPRPAANPDLFKPGTSTTVPDPPAPATSSIKNTTPNRQSSPATGAGKAGGKWQPLTSLEPNPEPEDHDPFSLGDSDEEPTDSKKVTKSSEVPPSAIKKEAVTEPVAEKSKATEKEKS